MPRPSQGICCPALPATGGHHGDRDRAGDGAAQPARRGLQGLVTPGSVVPRVVLGAREGPAFHLGAALGVSAQAVGAKTKPEAGSRYQARQVLPGASFPGTRSHPRGEERPRHQISPVPGMGSPPPSPGSELCQLPLCPGGRGPGALVTGTRSPLPSPAPAASSRDPPAL